jgi:hypothetical protein
MQIDYMRILLTLLFVLRWHWLRKKAVTKDLEVQNSKQVSILNGKGINLSDGTN